MLQILSSSEVFGNNPKKGILRLERPLCEAHTKSQTVWFKCSCNTRKQFWCEVDTFIASLDSLWPISRSLFNYQACSWWEEVHFLQWCGFMAPLHSRWSCCGCAWSVLEDNSEHLGLIRKVFRPITEDRSDTHTSCWELLDSAESCCFSGFHTREKCWEGSSMTSFILLWFNMSPLRPNFDWFIVFQVLIKLGCCVDSCSRDDKT